MRYADVMEKYIEGISGKNQREFYVEKLELGIDFTFNVRSYSGSVKVCFTRNTMLLWLYDAKIAIAFCFPSAWYDKIHVISTPINRSFRGVWHFDNESHRKFHSMEDEVEEKWEIELMRPFRGGNDHEVSGCDE